MNFGIGYDFFSVFLQSDTYSKICSIAYAALLLCPFIFWWQRKYATMLLFFLGAAFISVKLLSIYTFWGGFDEGQHLLMAYSLVNGGIPFKDFEGQSLGPLNAAFIALFSFGNISFCTARFAALFAELASAVMIFLTARKLCGIRSAIALASPVLFYYSIYTFDITGYNCETLFTLLISLWLLIFAFREDNRHVPYAECFVLGLLPWVKLQFAPCAVICFVLSLARCIFVHADANGGNYIPEKQRHDCAGVRSAIKLAVRLLMSKKAVLACLAATLPTLIFFVYLALNGAFKWFWLFYIIGNLEHVSVSLGTYLTDIGPYLFSFANLDMFWMASGTASAFIIISLSDIRKSAFRQRGTSSTKCLCQSVFWERVTEHVLTSKNAGIVLLVLFALTSLFSATRTMNLFYHYVNILLPCGVIFVALGLTLTDSRNGKRDQWALVMLLVTSLIYGDKLANYNDISKVQKYGLLSENYYQFKDVLHYLNDRVKPGEPVALWGWETNFAIYSNHPSATSTHYIYPLVSPKFTPMMKDKYIQDILDNKPVAIVDLVGPSAFAYKEKQWELANYDFIKKVADEYYEAPVSIQAGSGYARIYMRKKKID